jgi:hypothetical protein
MKKALLITLAIPLIAQATPQNRWSLGHQICFMVMLSSGAVAAVTGSAAISAYAHAQESMQLLPSLTQQYTDLLTQNKLTVPGDILQKIDCPVDMTVGNCQALQESYDKLLNATASTYVNPVSAIVMAGICAYASYIAAHFYLDLYVNQDENK